MYIKMNDLKRVIIEALTNKINKLAFYDFDDTLIKSPMPYDGKKIWHEKTGNPWPHAGWWGKHESLNTDVFSIKSIDPVIRRLNSDRSSGVLTVLLTNRLPKLESHIMKVLDSLGIELDEYTFASSPKGSRVVQYIDRYPDVKTIDVYDDNAQNLEEIETSVKQSGTDVELNLFLIKGWGIHKHR